MTNHDSSLANARPNGGTRMTHAERTDLARAAERAARYAAAEADALATALADLAYAARTGDAPAAIACPDIALDAADALAPIAPNVTNLARAVIAEQSTVDEYERAAALATDLAVALANAVPDPARTPA